ncbi:hypothetical protein BZG36_05613 [Bifiguratus adelaidae]|uniref:Ketoreductase (KR) domain-containing protein n=1 Tax=Bifiguratus adelaidae TaxID=1938954 RepID=A0A261XT10_9FUNG|nr:hypothetical protein BZG36_05613 [Bifiguratus adelaidae]
MTREQIRKLNLPLTNEEEPERYRWISNETLDTLPLANSVRGKAFVVTGGHAGLGAETTRALAISGATIILGSRNERKAQDAIYRIYANHRNAGVRYISLDLSDLESGRRFAHDFHATGLRLRSKSASCNLALIHLGHFLLIELFLIDDIGKIWLVVMSSRDQARYPVRVDGINFDDGKGYELWQAYSQSKTANILFAKVFNGIFSAKGVECFSLYPACCVFGATIDTKLLRHTEASRLVESDVTTRKGTPTPGSKPYLKVPPPNCMQ